MHFLDSPSKPRALDTSNLHVLYFRERGRLAQGLGLFMRLLALPERCQKLGEGDRLGVVCVEALKDLFELIPRAVLLPDTLGQAE